MAAEMTFYSSFYKYIADGTINLATDTLKLALVTSDYTPSVAHDVLADVMSSPSPEVEEVASPDNGYTTGGEALSGVSVTHTDSPSLATLDADDVEWTALTATFRYGILYAEKSVGSPAIVNPLICYILYDNEPDDVVVSGVDWKTKWSPSGILTITTG